MKVLLLLLAALAMWGGTVSPIKTVKTYSPILDFVIRDGKVYAGTDGGEVLQIDAKGKILSSIALKAGINAWGEKAVPKVMSLDIAPDRKTVAVASEEGKIYLIRNNTIIPTSYSTHAVIKKIGFISDTRLLIALLSNEIVCFDIQKNAEVKTISAGTSPLSDMSISSDLKTAVVAGEAGIVSVIDTVAVKIFRNIRGGNVDNVYKLDLQNGYIVTAGQDRRVIIYTIDGKQFVRYNGSFLIYSAALSPSAGRMAAALDEKNTISVFDTKSRRLIANAVAHQATLNRIAFIDEKRFVSCADENKILFWEIP